MQNLGNAGAEAYLGPGDVQLPHHLDVVPLPDALLQGRGAEVDEPPETEALQHPQLIQLRQVLPVPAHLWNSQPGGKPRGWKRPRVWDDFCAGDVIPTYP